MFKHKQYYYLFVSIINVLANVLLNIYLLKVLVLGVLGAIWAIILASIIQIIILLPVLIKNISFGEYNVSLLLKMKQFSWPFLPAAIFLIFGLIWQENAFFGVTYH